MKKLALVAPADPLEATLQALELGVQLATGMSPETVADLG